MVHYEKQFPSLKQYCQKIVATLKSESDGR